MANQITVNSGTGNITVTTSRSVIGTVANVASANYANFAGEVVDPSQPNITSVGNLTSLNVTGTTTTQNLVVTGNLQVGNLVANSANYANFAGVAYNVSGANVTGAVANATYAANAGSATTAANATYANTAGTAYSVDGANVIGSVNDAVFASTAGTAYSVDGANVIGEVPSAASANIANEAYLVAGANVSGEVANAGYATSAGYADTANSSNYADIANTAYAVDVANVSGIGNIATVNLDGNSSNVLKGDGTFGPEGSTGNANYANFAGTAFSVSGSNVSGAVANATYANDAGNADVANTAYNVNAANVSGLGNIATINLDGNSSNLLNGTGSWVAIPTNVANANYANFAGTVLTNAQPNITSTGNLTSITINNGIANTPTYQFLPNLFAFPTAFAAPNALSVIKSSGSTANLIQVDPQYLLKDRPGNAAAGSSDFIARTVFAANSSANGNIVVAGDNFVRLGSTPNVANTWVPATFTWRFATAGSNLANSNTFTTTAFNFNTLGGMIYNMGAPTQLSMMSVSGYGQQNGAIGNTANSTAFSVSRSRGNSDVRLTVEPNDYLGDITWVGTTSNGTAGTQTAKLRARVDNTYTANTTSMPIGFELVTVGNSSTTNTHYFYANGNVLFNNQISATGNVLAGAGNVTLNTNGTISYLRTFGSFTSNATQTSNGANTTNYMTFNNTEDANGVSVVSSTQLTVARTGRYNIQFSAQLTHDTNQTANIEIWLTKNGSAVANTNSRIVLVKDQPTIAAWNYVDNASTANTYYELAWASPDTNVELIAFDTANTISGVAIPSVIATITPVGA